MQKQKVLLGRKIIHTSKEMAKAIKKEKQMKIIVIHQMEKK